MMNRKYVILILSLFISSMTFSAIGTNGIHDPSSIIKHNGVYHVWGTGDQIYHLTSTDRIRWTAGKTVFETGTWPAWINTYVSTFGGFFWAPECVYMNGQYYMYYSCSMGDRPCAIGVATSTDLETWTDQGMVVSSNNSSTHGSIDPAVFKASNGEYWLTFGSHLKGIWVTPIDSVSGKRINTQLVNVAGNGTSWCENEAPFICYNNGYYYLFSNVGSCCAGINSTYTVKMGRSTTPTGPYLDKNGKNCVSTGGSIILTASGKYIGPGHFGLFTENGQHILTMHYYDGTSNGYPRLDIARLQFANDGWPYVERDIVADGRYTITNVRSKLNWELAACTGLANQPLVQDTPDSSFVCQQWDVESSGNGFYRFKSVKSTGAEQVIDIPFCNTSNKLATYDWLDNDCQKFKIFQHANGSYVFSTSVDLDKTISVPGGSTNPNVQLATQTYFSADYAQWYLNPVSATSNAVSEMSDFENSFQIFPNPSIDGVFSINLDQSISDSRVQIEIVSLNGEMIFSNEYEFSSQIDISAPLKPGVYIVRVLNSNCYMERKLVVKNF